MEQVIEYAKLFRLDGRRIAVVGGAGGIGREAVRALAAHGAEVIVADLDAAGAARAAEAAASEPPAPGSRAGTATAISLDVLSVDGGWTAVDGRFEPSV
ncbi:SDR family NAD(P)-dependent oxidoreductase [Streptomyces sp. NPDC017056]|uniref:SDR family NAD(P)-dependent oxidoreductase n=1 Tax=Streptomyces sp. NPDC017056 TaxID=3364973 RepID=UPI003793510D